MDPGRGHYGRAPVPVCESFGRDLGRRDHGKGGLAYREGLRKASRYSATRAPRLSTLCARLCHAAGGELEQIQFLLGHVSVETTERYLGCKQRIRSAVNDRIGIEPTS